MAKPRFSTQQKDILRRSDRAAVHAVLGRLAFHIHRGRWLGNNNIYRQNCIRVLDRPWRGQRRPINHRHLSEYIVASAPLHCTDGWSFLGRALDCHAQGDADTARHLGYYAELRGAMSLLAAEGIGIFSSHHFVVEAPQHCVELRRSGTHVVTWLALEHWAGLIRSTNLLATVVEPGGIPLTNWLDGFQGARSTWRPIGTKWLKSWGLDLRRLTDDRDARNESSYRPTRLNTGTPLDVSDSSEFMRSLWIVCEPSAPSRFELLDRHLLRLSLEEAFAAVTGREARNDPVNFESRVDAMLDAVAPSGLSVNGWRRFLLRDVQSRDASLMTEARGTVTVRDPRHHIQVIARAALLLRVAAGACTLLLRAAGFSRSELEFWWRNLGEERGLWEPGNEPDELADLWADVEIALDEIYQWEISDSGTNASYARWRRERSYEVSVLSECERIALWGLGL